MVDVGVQWIEQNGINSNGENDIRTGRIIWMSDATRKIELYENDR